MPEMELRIAIDGITINQSLDLLTVDTGTDGQKSQVRAAWKTYRTVLENLVTTVVLSDVLIFDAKIVRGSVKRDSAFSFMEELDRALRTPDSKPVVFGDLPPPQNLSEIAERGHPPPSPELRDPFR